MSLSMAPCQVEDPPTSDILQGSVMLAYLTASSPSPQDGLAAFYIMSSMLCAVRVSSSTFFRWSWDIHKCLTSCED
jgi:hypothetical protein